MLFICPKDIKHYYVMKMSHALHNEDMCSKTKITDKYNYMGYFRDNFQTFKNILGSRSLYKCFLYVLRT